MNERDIIRTQLATERIHAAQVANACASIYGAAGAAEAHTPFRDASVEYLVWVLSRFEQRDELLAELIERTAPGSAERADLPGELATLAGHTGTSRQALTRLEAALAAAPQTAGATWQAFAQFFNTVWCQRREAIESQFAKLPRIAGWCAVDADSILEERARYARVAAQLPPGVTLVGARQP